jgi:nitrous oxidase accessory protein
LNIAKTNDTIRIKPGVYESINTTINFPLTILGEGNVVLDGKGKDEVILVLANDVHLENLNIKNTNIGSMKDYAGIRVFKARNVSISNCKLQNTFFGIYLSDSKKCSVNNCQSAGANYGKSFTGNGIHLWKCDSISIANNHMEGHRDGIYFEFAKHCIITKNLCEKNFRYGLHFMFSDNDTYVNNDFTGNGTGVAVMYSKGIKMFNNRFENNWGDASYGLLLKDISNSDIRHNHFMNNTIGLTMEGSSNIHFQHNEFASNGYALRVWANCTNDTFVSNNFYNNTFDAATNGELQQDLFDYNYWDKYDGYDLNKDKIGDVPFHPVSMYSMLIQQMPHAVMLMHSFIVNLLDKAEKSIPSMTPNAFVDNHPLLKKHD